MERSRHSRCVLPKRSVRLFFDQPAIMPFFLAQEGRPIGIFKREIFKRNVHQMHGLHKSGMDGLDDDKLGEAGREDLGIFQAFGLQRDVR